ncbi:hypothetical protein [Luteimonas qiangzhengi]|uniref:hypothetical protein n=1 Tax=Luteimonas sp. MJ146 TaxID=3129240 RepID=UPI0031BB1514
MTQSGLNSTRCVRGALALERVAAEAPGALSLAQDKAGALAALVARDLAAFTADVGDLDLCMVAAHYDPAELLRPGWPLHEELAQLSARAPGDAGGRVIAFGSHEGKLPGTLTPNPAMAEGPLRLVPFVLTGPAEAVDTVGETFENQLLERGMADAGSALLAQEAFGLQVEHARYLTLHDLCAMTALQYDHAGLSRVWPILETALLAPQKEAWLDIPPEPLLRYADGEVRIAMFSPDHWRRHYGGDEQDEARLARGYMHFEGRQRQVTALLQAHGIPVTFAHCRSDGDPREELA